MKPATNAGNNPHAEHGSTESSHRRPAGLSARGERMLNAITNFTQVTLTPFSEKQGGRVGLYYIGSWPAERGARGPGKAPADRYANPRGFIQVTQQNETTHVSEHFRFKDFLTHDQQGVWPKYI